MVVAFALFLSLAACSSQGTAVVALKSQPPATEAPKILQFYARDFVLTEGGSTVLCYGVANAQAVRIDPPVEGVWPSPARCVEIAPKQNTHYVLTAEGADGKSVSQSFDLRVTANQEAMPKINSFQVAGCSKDYAGKAVISVTFAAEKATEISIDPPVFPPLHGTLFGKFYVTPTKSASYILTASGKNGHTAQKTLTVDPGDCR